MRIHLSRENSASIFYLVLVFVTFFFSSFCFESNNGVSSFVSVELLEN